MRHDYNWLCALGMLVAPWNTGQISVAPGTPSSLQSPCCLLWAGGDVDDGASGQLLPISKYVFWEAGLVQIWDQRFLNQDFQLESSPLPHKHRYRAAANAALKVQAGLLVSVQCLPGPSRGQLHQDLVVRGWVGLKDGTQNEHIMAGFTGI